MFIRNLLLSIEIMDEREQMPYSEFESYISFCLDWSPVSESENFTYSDKTFLSDETILIKQIMKVKLIEVASYHIIEQSQNGCHARISSAKSVICDVKLW